MQPKLTFKNPIISSLSSIEKIVKSGGDPDYIHWCKCWSHICSDKVIKKIPEYPFSPTNYFILFFCQSKRLKRLRPRYAVIILQNLSNVVACLPCGKNCFCQKYWKIQKYSRNSLKIPWLYTMFVFQMPAEFSKMHGLNRLQVMLYGNCFNSPSLKYFDHF